MSSECYPPAHTCRSRCLAPSHAHQLLRGTGGGSRHAGRLVPREEKLVTLVKPTWASSPPHPGKSCPVPIPTAGPPSPLAAEPAVTEACTGILTACFLRGKARGAGSLGLHPPKPDERRGSDSRAPQLCFLVRGEHSGPGGARPLPASTTTRVANTGQLQQGDVMHRTWTHSASSALASG